MLTTRFLLYKLPKLLAAQGLLVVQGLWGLSTKWI